MGEMTRILVLEGSERQKNPTETWGKQFEISP